MSQAGIINASGVPTAATTFVTDAGIATPALNILNIITAGGGTDGIQTSGAGNTITITPTPMSITGGAVTIGAVTANPVTLGLGAVAGTYTLNIIVSAFSNTTAVGGASPAVGAGYGIVASVRTTGAAAVLVPNQAVDEMEEAALLPCNAAVVVAGNNAIIQVTGTAGLTVEWNVVAQYVFT